MESDRRDQGFSLVELLVVIVVLGILATVTVFAVRGLADRGETTTCSGDRRIMTNAMESRFADRGSYTDEVTLASEGFLRAPSTLHDVTLVGEDYTIVPVGACAAGSPTTVASGGGTTTTTTPPLVVTSFTIAGFPAQQYGDGSGAVGLFFGAGTSAGELAATAWGAFQGFPIQTNESVVWVDLRSAGNGITNFQLFDIIAAVNPDIIVMQQSAPPTAVELIANSGISSNASSIPRCWVAAGAALTDCQMAP